MKWLAKAALQRSLGVLPEGERLNYLFQRHVAHSLPAGESVFRRMTRRPVFMSWLTVGMFLRSFSSANAHFK